jgi:hypothetical protein
MSAGWAGRTPPPRACASLCRRVRRRGAVSAGQQGASGGANLSATCITTGALGYLLNILRVGPVMIVYRGPSC